MQRGGTGNATKNICQLKTNNSIQSKEIYLGLTFEKGKYSTWLEKKHEKSIFFIYILNIQ